MANEAPDSRSRRSSWLAHPALLLVLTAALTGLLVPWFTNRWEARDKQVEASRAATSLELEVKSKIVSHMGTSSAKFLSAIEVGVIDKAGARAPEARAEARAEYRALKTASLEIASQLAAYFPRSRPQVAWRDFTYSLRNAYLLLGEPPGRARNQWLDKLNRYLDKKPKALDGLCFPSTSPHFAEDIRELVLAFQNKQAVVVREVTESNTVLTGTPTRDFNVKRRYYDPTKRRPCDLYFS